MLHIVTLLPLSGVMDAIIVVPNLYVHHNWFIVQLPESNLSTKKGNVGNRASLHMRFLN